MKNGIKDGGNIWIIDYALSHSKKLNKILTMNW